MQSSPRSLLSILALSALLSACQSARVEENPTWLIRHGRFSEAVEVAQADLSEAPDDPELQRVLREARIAWTLDQGRQVIFTGEAEVALSIFQSAYEMDPENPVVRDWVLKARRQLAVDWLDRAHELAARQDQLEEALEAYERALEYEPQRDSEVAGEALSGASRVLLLKNYRLGLSKTYYDEGLRAFREYRLHPSRRGFSISDDIGEGELDASQRLERVDAQLVEERVAQAQELERQGLYYAAANEFRLALLIDPGHKVALEGFNRLDREVRANRALSKADMDIRRGDFELGAENIAEGERLTEAQKPAVTKMKAAIEEAQLSVMYEQARTFERDYKYPEAVAAYDALLEETEFFEDAVARRETVLWLMASAEELYGKALEAADDDEAYSFLWEIHELVWPEYKDVEERLAAIQARRDAAGESEDPAGTTPGEGGTDEDGGGESPR